MFQHQARTAPITLQQLLAAAAAGRVSPWGATACSALATRSAPGFDCGCLFRNQCTPAMPSLHSAAHLPLQGPSGDADVLLHMTSTASMSLVASEARWEAEGSMLTDGGGSVGLEVEMG